MRVLLIVNLPYTGPIAMELLHCFNLVFGSIVTGLSVSELKIQRSNCSYDERVNW